MEYLYCLENSAEGGDSIVVDGFRAAERLRANPDFQLFFKECRDEQVALFLTPATDEAALKEALDAGLKPKATTLRALLKDPDPVTPGFKSPELNQEITALIGAEMHEQQ